MLLEIEALKKWFLTQKRDLPWRGDPSPYAVWISEIMLQQTQVSVVKEYFIRWMERFPNVEKLAGASLEEVLKAWEGLGYYSRARYIHSAAKYFMENHAGAIPADKEVLEKVKGLGPYTIGAILNFAFHQRAPAVDANVERVLARYFGVKRPMRKKMEEIAESILPQEESWIVAEGLIELGAIVCKRDPKCRECPLKNGCRAFALNKQYCIPVKKKRPPCVLLKRDVMVIYFQDEFLLRKGKPGRVMAELYEFPYFEQVEHREEACFPFPLVFDKPLKREKHSFTRYKVELFPAMWKAMAKKEIDQYDWIPWEKICTLPFSSGHRRVLESIKKDRK